MRAARHCPHEVFAMLLTSQRNLGEKPISSQLLPGKLSRRLLGWKVLNERGRRSGELRKPFKRKGREFACQAGFCKISSFYL